MGVIKEKNESRQQRIEEIKQRLAEREGQLNAEMVKARIQAILAERQQSPK